MSVREATGPLPPGAVIGILGGGQLGRMTALAAARFGYSCSVYTPEGGDGAADADAPAGLVAASAFYAPWSNTEALAQFAQSCDVVTYEFENIPVEAAQTIEQHGQLRPSALVLAICQDRLREKTFLADIGVPTAPWQTVDDAADLRSAVAYIGPPAVLKTARLGYDGKGQAAIRADTDLAAAWAEAEAAGGAGAVLEQWVDFALEISVVVARGADGETVTYVPVENRHEHHILRRTTAPAPVPPEVAADADALARRIAGALDLVGVLAVEMFVGRDGRVLVNELAPRPHNSGHWTIDACAVSQFEQCVRAVAGLPLGPTDRHADAVMENLLGFEIDAWRMLVADPQARLHLYGKRAARPGRKMGHVTRLYPRGSLAAGRPPKSDAR